MGVPGFFLWLMKKYNLSNNTFIFDKEKLEKTDKLYNQINNIDYLLIDCNCLLHPTCFKVLAEFNKTVQNIDNITIDKLEDNMINECIKYIQYIIDYAKVNKTIYIAIDGVAPVAKIKQQRMRRFKSVADKKLWDNIKKKHNQHNKSYNWNNSAITPGTKFMIKLHKTLLNWIEKFNSKNKTNIIYSSCFTPMEGEHKLLQYVRNLENNNKYSYLFYGLDADLIFLALSTNLNNIYLLRESTEFNLNDSIEVFKYVSIDIMKDNIFNTFNEYNKSEIKLNKDKIIKDFIFICYFLGNDFLPHILSTDIHNNGIDNMIKNYMKTFLLKYEYIINNSDSNYNINMNILLNFLQNISLEESDLLLEIANKKKKRFTNGKTEYEIEIYKIENLMFKINDPIRIGLDDFSNYRKRYYKYYWNLEDDEIEEFSKNLVSNYMKGIYWVTLYYFDKCPSWEWYYPYDYPPFITDIVNYFPKTNIIFNNNDKPLNPYMQLLAVLPKQCSYLLPKGLGKLMESDNSSLTYLYPIEFEQDFINKTKYWMGIPKLPPLNIPLIKHIFEKYKDDLTKEELIWCEII
jgi:5'-3' exonuclease